MRPKLNQHIKTKEFLSYYWLKKELQGFCHDHHIPRSGSKAELTEQIHLFLQTGEIKRPVHKKTGAPNGKKLEELSLDTVITKHHRCSQSVRTFFKTIIPNFHFSTYIQNYFKQNSGKTYRDVVTAWYEEESRKKDPSYQREIGAQFEYNQFTRDFFADPTNKGKSRADAIAAWRAVKEQPGARTYKRKN
ncbi:DUF6434 domain-containing protein [Priestia flexa]|uniref:DUF6434 domain-containing protein n=1 Tax=Priestia flexa TaxID=86664 RepID=UPI00240DDF2F|nr:DUF6434 domain-containing protein [Priestia flexa]WEZ06924.1 DUF6434 domain-containing protein [Priestia flexa]